MRVNEWQKRWLGEAAEEFVDGKGELVNTKSSFKKMNVQLTSESPSSVA